VSAGVLRWWKRNEEGSEGTMREESGLYTARKRRVGRARALPVPRTQSIEV